MSLSLFGSWITCITYFTFFSSQVTPQPRTVIFGWDLTGEEWLSGSPGLTMKSSVSSSLSLVAASGSGSSVFDVISSDCSLKTCTLSSKRPLYVLYFILYRPIPSCQSNVYYGSVVPLLSPRVCTNCQSVYCLL